MVKIWVDDVRPAPEGYFWIKSTQQVIIAIGALELDYMNQKADAVLIDLDHDAGEYAEFGGDYIKILDWIEENAYLITIPITFHIHSMNPVGVQNMRTIIQKNGWTEI